VLVFEGNEGVKYIIACIPLGVALHLLSYMLECSRMMN